MSERMSIHLSAGWGCGRELLAAVDVVRRAGQGGVAHQMDRQCRDVLRTDDASTPIFYSIQISAMTGRRAIPEAADFKFVRISLA